MVENDPNLIVNLKSLEGKKYDSEMALFDTLNEAGVQLPKGYRDGGRNKKLTKKEAERYIDYKPLCELDPNCKKKRAVTITKVHNQPKPKENERGAKGRYADYLIPLIVKTAQNSPFYGTKAELFDNWGVYDNYREEQIKEGLFNPKNGHSFNPWMIIKTMQPGESKYCQVISFKERNSLETALNSLCKRGIIEWNKYTRYVPMIKTTELVNSIERLKTWQEYREDCDKRWKLVTQWSKKENCILSPELFRLGLYVTTDTYQKWSEQYCYSSGERLPNERATMEQESMYDNYQTFIRQLTICECSKSEEFCLPENIPNTYDIFTDWTYRRTYNELDKNWKGMILGWEQVRQELYFKVIDKEGALKYLARYSPELAFELGCEYILYMDEHMDKEKLYYPPNYTFDFNGIISNDESNRLFPLLTSKSASKLHNNMKKHFHLENTNGTTPPLR